MSTCISRDLASAHSQANDLFVEVTCLVSADTPASSPALEESHHQFSISDPHSRSKGLPHPREQDSLHAFICLLTADLSNSVLSPLLCAPTHHLSFPTLQRLITAVVDGIISELSVPAVRHQIGSAWQYSQDSSLFGHRRGLETPQPPLPPVSAALYCLNLFPVPWRCRRGAASPTPDVARGELTTCS